VWVLVRGGSVGVTAGQQWCVDPRSVGGSVGVTACQQACRGILGTGTCQGLRGNPSWWGGGGGWGRLHRSGLLRSPTEGQTVSTVYGC
jgi:hypothetical protein